MKSSKASGITAAGAPSAFLEKLYEMLSSAENERYISWQPSGEAFLIRDVTGLQDIVLPRYFKHNNLNSFIRQLNMYSFSKTSHDPNYREFKNGCFLRGRRDLLQLIRRKAQSSGKDEAVEADHHHQAHQAQSPPIAAEGEAVYDGVAGLGGPAEGGGGLETLDDLRQRVKVLETKTYVLSERYHELACKHDSLCTTLQTVFQLPGPAFAGGGSSSSSSSSRGGTDDSSGSKPRGLSEGTLSEEDGTCPRGLAVDNALTRMISIDPTMRDDAFAPSLPLSSSSFHSSSSSSSAFSSATKRSVSECAGLSGDHRHLLLEALTSSSRMAALPLTLNIGASSLGRGTPGRGLLDLVDAATFSVSVHAPASAMAGRPLARMATIATSTVESAGGAGGGGARGAARKRTKVDGEKLSRMNTY